MKTKLLLSIIFCCVSHTLMAQDNGLSTAKGFYPSDKNNEVGLFWQTPLANIDDIMRNDVIALQYMRRWQEKRGLRMALGYSGTKIQDYYIDPHSRQDTTFYQHITNRSNLLYISLGLETQKHLIANIFLTAIIDCYYNSGVTVKEVYDIVKYADSTNSAYIERTTKSIKSLPLTGIGFRPTFGLKWYLNSFVLGVEANACDIGYNFSDKKTEVKTFGTVLNYRFGLSYRF